MGFFDELGSTISRASSKAAKKTKEAAERARLNGELQMEIENQKKLYEELGRLYMETHPEGVDLDFVELANKIHASSFHQNELREQIQDLRGVVVCPNCGAESKEGTAFCSHCGSPLPVKPAPAPEPEAPVEEAAPAEPEAAAEEKPEETDAE